MNKAVLLIGVIILLVIFGFVGWQTLGKGSKVDTQAPPQTSEDTSQLSTAGTVNNQFQNPKKSTHYESNTPAHGVTLAGVPINVVIDFNFDLANGSSISITNNGKEYGVGQTLIDSNPLAMRQDMDSNAPNGIYTVSYKACWADGSCHDGNFQFAVDKSKAADFVDMKNKKEVTVSLRNNSFNPQDLRVSAGTKVTWVNEDNVVHTVNTDSHPAHTFYPNQNSRNLNKGDKYSVTFDKPGIYPYHCTPHADFMTGSILVE